MYLIYIKDKIHQLFNEHKKLTVFYIKKIKKKDQYLQ